MAEATIPSVLVAGNPNSGKTTLFNRLTGARARVGNYAGVTVERREGLVKTSRGRAVMLVDLPGAYSLSARSAEERVAIDAVVAHDRAAPVVLVLDATNLKRGLYLALQLVELGAPLVVALNMADDARRLGIEVDHAVLGKRLGCEVIPIVAVRGEGLGDLLAAIDRAIDAATSTPTSTPTAYFPADVDAAITRVAEAYATTAAELSPPRRRALAAWALVSVGGDELDIPAAVRDAVLAEQREGQARGARDIAEALIRARYAQVDEIVERTVRERPPERRPWRERVDDLLLHPFLGLLTFIVVMAITFQALFSWSEPIVALVEAAIEGSKSFIGAALPEGLFRNLVTDGIISGVGNVLVFIPQIAILFVFITFLEDSGYLARVAFVIDRLMGGIGLHGRAFVPMLSGFACAIPAVMATRTIESRRDRLLTMMVVPLTSCSARLPVYVLVAATVFDTERTILGVMSVGAFVLLAMYTLSICAALLAAFVLRRTVFKGPRPILVLELPPYRLPSVRNVGFATYERVKRFVVDAGTVILALTILLWAGLTFPRNDEATARAEAHRAEAAQIAEEAPRTERLAEIDRQEASEKLSYSVAGRLGKGIEPAIEPLGFDWRVGIGILAAFAAREVFVSTLAVVFEIEDASDESKPLRAALQSATHHDGRKLFTPLAGVSLMVFFVLAAQCMSTIAVVRRESGSWKWPIFLFAYMSVFAYVASLLVYQVGLRFGWGLS